MSDLAFSREADEKPSILLVDGMALLFRGFYATSYSGYIMKTSSGMPTNAVFGFIKYFLDAVETFRPSHVVCCWDMGSKTFRNEQFEGYKANRGDTPEELIPQFDLIKEVVSVFGVPNVGVKGFEADDCIGTLAEHYSRNNQVYILTGDRDMLQLIDERIHVVIMKKGQSNYAVYDHLALRRELNLIPDQIVDLKGLMGDPSDNYPGVKGIGEKTALKLLHEYGTIEGILQNLQKLPKGVRTKIEAEIDMLHLSHRLARIRRDAPVICELEECRWEPDPHPIREKFKELEFKSLLNSFFP